MSEDKSRARLGRGLASLIGAGGTAGRGDRAPSPFPSLDAAAAQPAGGERRVSPDRLVANPRNPRRNFVEADLADLTASVKAHGVVQPILVRRRPDHPTGFEIVAGERRWRAAKAAGLEAVPVVIREISDRESLEIAIIENVQRADLNAIEEADGYQALIDEHGYTQADLGEVMGKSRSHVANTLRLLKLPKAVREMVADGRLTAGAARTAVSADDPEAFARRIVEGGLSVREAEEAARTVTPETARSGRKAGAARRKSTEANTDDDTAALEQLLSQAVAMPVHIALKGNGGSLRLEFADLEELDDLCRLLQGGKLPDRATGPRVRTL